MYVTSVKTINKTALIEF
jgi:apolipoprotein D and lipocalin family protein